MKLDFEESQSSYDSGSQKARVGTWAYCPHCDNAKMASPTSTGGTPRHRGGWKKR
jgi:hypothetical protein